MAVLFTVVTLTTAILAGSLGNSGLLATRTAQASLASPERGDAGLQVQTRLGDDFATQDGIARDALSKAFSPVEVETWTTLISEPFSVDGGRLVAWAGEQYAPGNLEPTEGTWPASEAEAALQADAAETLGLGVGSELTVGDHSLTVTALWRAADPSAGLWLDDPLVVGGTDRSASGPLIVSAPVVESLGSPYVRWVSLPDVSSITAQQLGLLAERAGQAAEDVKAADVSGRGLVVTGDLGPTAEQAARDSASGDAFGFVPVSVLVLIALVGLTQVAGLLSAARERETSLLFARGASLRQVLASTLLEYAVVALIGSALGTALAALVIRLAAGDWSQTLTVALGGVAGFALSLVCLTVVGVRAALAGAGGHEPPRHRVRNIAGAALLVLVAIAATVATWQLRRTGTFVTVDEEGSVRLDIVSALAPALLLAVSAVVALVLLAPVTRLLELLARRAPTGQWLAANQVARGLTLHAVAVVLTVLGTGTATFAALFAGTSAGIASGVSTVEQAAPVRATLSAATEDTPLMYLPDVAQIDGVTSSAPVWRDPSAQLGDALLPLVAVPTDRLDSLVHLPDSARLPDVAALRTDDAGGVPIPDGAARLTVSMDLSVGLDPWQELALGQVPETSRQNSIANGDTDEQSIAAQIEAELQRYTQPATVAATLRIRDTDTGQVSDVVAPALTVAPEAPTHGAGFTGLALADATGRGSFEVALPTSGSLMLESVQVKLSDASGVGRSREATVRVDVDGRPLFGEATAHWSSPQAIPTAEAGPYREAEKSATPARLVTTTIELPDGAVELREPNYPPRAGTEFDSTGEALRIAQHEAFGGTGEASWTLDFGPTLGFLGEGDPLGVMTQAEPPQPLRLPVALTPATARAASLVPGDSIEIGAFGTRIPATVAAITDVVPSVPGAEGILADSNALATVTSQRSAPVGAPQEFWVGTQGDPLAVGAAVAGLAGVESVSTASPGSGGPAEVAANALWVAAGCAMALAIAGLAATSATTVAARRSEVAVLRALGMTPRAQARSRAWEGAGVLLLATALGVLGGWLVSLLVVRPVALTATQDDPSFPTVLRFDWLPWLILLAALAVAATLIVAWQAATVRRQALDSTYREEVR